MNPIMIFLLFVGIGVAFLSFNPSYQHAIYAKALFSVGDYEKALLNADKAHKEDKYNKLAWTLMQQSKNALEYTKFIQLCEEYMQKIKTINQKKEIDIPDKARIKMLSEVIIGEFQNLPHSKLVDEDLILKAVAQKDKFVIIRKELFID